MNVHFSKLKPGMMNALVPPNFTAFMCGCKLATQTREGVITLTYTDETQESALCSRDLLTEFHGNFLDVVSFVQAERNTSDGTNTERN